MLSMMNLIMLSQSRIEGRLSIIESWMSSIASGSPVTFESKASVYVPAEKDADNSDKTICVRATMVPAAAPLHSEIANASVRPVIGLSLQTVPDPMYGGMSEKKYMDAFFPSRTHLYPCIITCLCNDIQSTVEGPNVPRQYLVNIHKTLTNNDGNIFICIYSN